MSMIDISNLTFAYDGTCENIFTNVSLRLDTDWKLGFCGRNGRGKTTLLKLLMGEYEYDGKITSDAEFEYFPFAVADISRNTFDVLQELSPGAELWRIQRELSKLAVDGDALGRPFSSLSNGERTKALLAGLFLRQNSFLLIDEPTNHLDMTARGLAARYLNGKTGFILVSHDRAFLDDCTDHTLSINREGIEVIKGSFSVWLEQKKRQDDFELARNERLKNEIGRLRQAAARTSSWSDRVEGSKNKQPKSGLKQDKGYVGHKAAKMMKRSKSIEKRRQEAAGEKSGLLKNIEVSETIRLRPLSYHTPNLVTLENAAVYYGGREAVSNVSFTLERGDRLLLRGGNGSGKSSIMKLICGQDIGHTGLVRIGSGLIISYVPQDASFLSGGLNEYASEQELDRTLFITLLRKLGFSRTQFEKNMRDYSAGQKKKVLLARSFCESAHVYVWDEPLNYIDVMSRMQIEELITEYKPTLLFAEHDRAFCDNIATKTVEI